MAFSLNFDQGLRKTLKDVAPQYDWVTGWPADRRFATGVPKLGLTSLVLLTILSPTSRHYFPPVFLA